MTFFTLGISNSAKFWLVKLSVIFIGVTFLCLAQTDYTQAVTSKKCLKTKINPIVSFQQKNVKTTVNRSKTSAQITRFAKKISAYQRRKGKRLLGLAYTEMRSGIGIEVRGLRIGKRTCISLKKVKFNFNRVHSEIFVARKYKPGTCAYKAVLAHEREHMQINDRVQKKYAQKLKKLLIERVGKVRPFFTSNPKKAPKFLINRFNNDMRPLINQFNKERKKLNGKIDTPKSYKNTHSKCAKW